jgi:hypothetical protein
VISNTFKTLLVSIIVLEALTLAEGNPAFAAPAGKVYSVCEVWARHALNSHIPKNIVDEEITIRAEVGRTHHLGMFLTDDHCDTKIVRIIFPVPDPKNIYYRSFRMFEANQPAIAKDDHFMCDCSGRINFKYYFPILKIDDAVVTKLNAPENSIRN